MPIGCFSLIPHVTHHLVTHQPQRILDLGAGFGMYGAVVRQWLDLGVTPAKSFLVGVEAWAAYRSPLWDLYNLMIVDSIQNYLRSCTQRFDCVIMNDVIEHFEKEEGGRVLDRLRDILEAHGSLLVGTPGIFGEQGAVYGNEYERHRSLWTAADFLARGFRIVMDGTVDQFGNQMVLAAWQNA